MKTASYISGVAATPPPPSWRCCPPARRPARPEKAHHRRYQSRLVRSRANAQPRLAPPRALQRRAHLLGLRSPPHRRGDPGAVPANVHLTMTSVDLVRGALAAAHAFVQTRRGRERPVAAYRAWAESEPFVRVVKDRRGIYRVPEPKILAGTNYVDVGFELDPKRAGGVHGRHRQPDERRLRFRRAGHEPDVRF
jgi:hypothetical protein